MQMVKKSVFANWNTQTWQWNRLPFSQLPKISIKTNFSKNKTLLWIKGLSSLSSANNCCSASSNLLLTLTQPRCTVRWHAGCKRHVTPKTTSPHLLPPSFFFLFLSSYSSSFLLSSFPLSLSLSLPPANSLEHRNPLSSFSSLGFQHPLERAPCAFVNSTSPVLAFYWFSAWTREYQLLSLFHFLIIDSRPPGSGPLKDCNTLVLSF